MGSVHRCSVDQALAGQKLVQHCFGYIIWFSVTVNHTSYSVTGFL